MNFNELEDMSCAMWVKTKTYTLYIKIIMKNVMNNIISFYLRIE